jgi:hypothetical protein
MRWYSVGFSPKEMTCGAEDLVANERTIHHSCSNFLRLKELVAGGRFSGNMRDGNEWNGGIVGRGCLERSRLRVREEGAEDGDVRGYKRGNHKKQGVCGIALYLRRTMRGIASRVLRS